MLDFLLNTILSKNPNVAVFATKLEGCQQATKLELQTVGDLIKKFGEQVQVVNDAIEEKQKTLNSDHLN